MHHSQQVTPQNRVLRCLHRTDVRAVITALACLIPVVPSSCSSRTTLIRRALSRRETRTTLSPPRDDYYGVPTEVYSADGPVDFCVTFEFLGLNRSPNVSLGILVGVTSAGKAALTGLSAHGYQEVSVVVRSDSGLSNFEVPIAVSVLAAAPVTPCGAHPPQSSLDQDAAYRATWTPSLLGQPRAFPQDWYELDDSVGVIAGNSPNGKAFPSSLVMMSRDEDLRIGVQIDQGTYQNLPYQNLPSMHQLFFTVHRPPWVITYTYWVAAMPFLLLVALLFFKRFAQRQPLEPSNAAFGLAAAMVAILPLRQVLVPSTIPGPTRLDLLFGLGICFLVAASILWAVVWVPPEQDPEPHEPGPSAEQNQLLGRSEAGS